MPTTEFETALTERIEFAVFVAYEQWVRASNYSAANPYDVLARLLPALPESLTHATSSRGGWGAFDPVNGLPTDQARQLISEMTAQVVKARIAALASDAPQADQLVTVIVDAINRSVTTFVEDPENWRLALGQGERAPVAALSDGVGTAAGEGVDHDPFGHLPPAPEHAEAGGDFGGSPLRVVQTAEAVGRSEAPTIRRSESSPMPDFLQMMDVGDLWFVKGGSTKIIADAAMELASLFVDFGGGGGGSSGFRRDLLDGLDGSPSFERGPPDGPLGGALGSEPKPGPAPAYPTLPTDPPVQGTNPIDPRYNLPLEVAAVIDQWFVLLSKAKFYRVQEDGSIYRLNQHEAQEVVQTLIEVLVRRAQLDLSLPQLPATAAPATPGSTAPPQAKTETVAAADPAAAAGLGSDTLHIPPAAPAPDNDESVIVSPAPIAAADPIPDGAPMASPADYTPTVLPPLVQTATDPWQV